MKITIDSDVCAQNNLSMHAVLYMLLMNDNVNLANLRDSVCLKHGVPDKWCNWRMFLNSDDKALLSAVLTESNVETVSNNKTRFEELAVKLQNIYPAGKKPGTPYPWRDSKLIIKRRLEKLVEKYGDCFTDEEAINATKKYVESFNGNYNYMKLLKYFIWKNEVRTGEVEEESQLLSYIENLKELNTNSSTFDNSFDELRV